MLGKVASPSEVVWVVGRLLSSVRIEYRRLATSHLLFLQNATLGISKGKSLAHAWRGEAVALHPHDPSTHFIASSAVATVTTAATSGRLSRITGNPSFLAATIFP